jgi:hypothetical protein
MLHLEDLRSKLFCNKEFLRLNSSITPNCTHINYHPKNRILLEYCHLMERNSSKIFILKPIDLLNIIEHKHYLI